MVLQGHTDCVYSVSATSKGTIIASGSDDGTTSLWDTITGAEITKFEDPCEVGSIALSPNCETVASGLWDGTLRLRNFTKGETFTLKGHSDLINQVAFSLNGSLMASASKDKTLRLWDIEERKELRVVEFTEGSPTSVAFSPDCRTVAVGGGVFLGLGTGIVVMC